MKNQRFESETIAEIAQKFLKMYKNKFCTKPRSFLSTVGVITKELEGANLPLTPTKIELIINCFCIICKRVLWKVMLGFGIVLEMKNVFF